MTTATDRFLEAHPDAAGAWYPTAVRVAGRALALPGLGRVRPVAGRVHAVARPAGRTTVRADPTTPPRADLPRLTVMSANLWHDWPRQHRWSARLAAVARLVEGEDVDIVLLQEVARTPAHRADEWLAGRCGMAWAYARANGAVDAIGFEEGLAVLSRFPITGVRLRQFGGTRNPLVRRVALAADVATPRGPVAVVSAHLALRRRDNAAQLRLLRAWVDGGGGVVVVGGDLNAPEDRAGIAELRRAWTDTFREVHPEAAAATHRHHGRWQRWRGERRLDYVFVRQPPGSPWRVLDAEHVHDVDAPHSDHRAVLARLAPPDPPPPQRDPP